MFISLAPTYLLCNQKILKGFNIFFKRHLQLMTEAMSICRFAGAFAVMKRQGECGSKTC